MTCGTGGHGDIGFWKVNEKTYFLIRVMNNLNNFHYKNVKNNETQENQDCRYVNQMVPYWLDSKSEFSCECARFVNERKLEFSNHAIQSYFCFTDDDNILQIRYCFFPSNEGFKNYPKVRWAHSPWNKTSVSSDLKKGAYVDSIIKWTDTYYSTVKTGFKGGLTTIPLVVVLHR